MTDFVKTVLSELAKFISPLGSALEDEEALGKFLLNFGYEVDVSALSGAVQQLGPLATATVNLVSRVENDLSQGGVDNINVDAVIALVTTTFTDLDNFGDAFNSIQGLNALPNKAENLGKLPGDVLAHLLTRYLKGRADTALRVLELIGVHHTTSVLNDSDQRWRGARYDYSAYNWARLGQLFRDPDAWGQELYGWGTDFDSNTALVRLGAILETITSLTRFEQMTDVQVQHFLPSAAGDGAKMIVAPLLAETNNNNTAEVGAALFPVSGAGAQRPPADRGLALGPYSIGNLNQTVAVFGGQGELSIQGAIGSLGGAILSMRPSGLSADIGVGATAFNGEFGAELVVAPPDGQEHIVLIGEADGTRLQIDQVNVKGGGSVTSAQDFDGYFAAGVTKLTMVIDPSDDGLLGGVLSGPLEINAGDLALGWRPGRGLYFEGGSNLGIVVPVELSFGPVNITEFGIALEFDEPMTVKLTATGDLTVGPLFAYAEDIGVSISLVEALDADGIFGKHDVDFGFVSPSSYALALQSDVISGGGYLSIEDTKYRGALALKFQTFGFSAFAILNTELPGEPGKFSFAASIFGEFSVPLSFGFFLTGIGGFIGINRTIDSEALRSVLYEGRLDNLIFPSNPIENAASILEDMANVMPPQSGQHIIGPVVKIGWGQPSLVNVKLGIIIEVGDEVRIIILGGLDVILPTEPAAIVHLSITFFGEIDFSARTISFDATLTGSRILTYTLSGDAAIRTGWAPRLEHVASFGGLHPSFPRPSNLPDLNAITLAFGTDNPRITISGYVATTSNSLQFGARADLYAKGPKLWLIGQLAAEGYVYLDALVYFDPFAFDVALGGGLSLLRNGSSVLSLGFDLRLRGPNTFYISGKVWAKILGKKVKFSVTHRWGTEQSLPAPSADPVALLRQALEKSAGFEAVAPVNRAGGVSFVAAEEGETLIDPLGGARLTQTAVPLDVTIEKVGEGQIAGGPARLDLDVFDANGQAVDTTDVDQSFVHGHFYNLTDAERLRATAFDTLKGGVEMVGPGLMGPTNKAIQSDYTYEYVEIPVQPDAPPIAGGALVQSPKVLEDVLRRYNSRELEMRAQFERVDRLVRPPSAAPVPVRDIFVNEDNFGDVGTFFDARAGADGVPGAQAPDVRDDLVSTGLGNSSFAQANNRIREVGQPAVDRAHEVNPVMTDYVFAAGRL